ncbi:hypothetical protein O181_010441 [Austropuccinia psidii MF-1]|uniref:Uncharacterized protein n=1 Tax=Austropuccinia psidii MF-1 TaxID=1389203 RepID=A0A9Q3GKE7_9BASI|nr:hypothetical protein [Austropuccinia psidii MF-1]
MFYDCPWDTSPLYQVLPLVSSEGLFKIGFWNQGIWGKTPYWSLGPPGALENLGPVASNSSYGPQTIRTQNGQKSHLGKFSQDLRDNTACHQDSTKQLKAQIPSRKWPERLVFSILIK